MHTQKSRFINKNPANERFNVPNPSKNEQKAGNVCKFPEKMKTQFFQVKKIVDIFVFLSLELFDFDSITK